MSTLEFHPLADLFPLLEGKEFEAFMADIKAHGLRDPIDIHEEKILEGRNRYRACIKAGVEPTYRPFTGNDPLAYVISKNIHRRHLTAEQKRDLIAKLIKATPEKSDRQIAETVKASHHTVGAVRAEMEGRGQIAHVESRTDTKGRQQPARKPPTDKIPRRSPVNHGVRGYHHEAKLGAKTLQAIEDTSLDSSKEKDALVGLNRGAEPGQLTPIVKKLVEDAKAGKAVSAIAYSCEIGGRKAPKEGLMAAWSKRMVCPWKLASPQERKQLVDHLSALSRNEAA